MLQWKPTHAVALLAGVGILAGASGCGKAGDEAAVRRATAAFFAAAAAHQDGGACADLVPQAAKSLQSSDSSCADEIGKLKLTGGTIRVVRVWGYRAQVVMTADTVFLSRLPQGWKVAAAGCRPQAQGPYDCDVEA
jgi:hypothetical protein